MNPIKITILIIFVLHAGLSFAQDTTATFIYPRNQLKTNPFKLIDLANPGLDIAYERSYGRHFSTMASAAGLVNFLGISPYRKYIGYRFSIEQKYITPFDKIEKIWIYPSVSLVYNRMNITAVGKFVDTGSNTPYAINEGYNDTFSLRKETFSINACGGMLIPFDRFFIDISAGLGIKSRSVIHMERIKTDDVLETPRHPNIFHEALSEGAFNTISIVLSARIGYTF